MSYKVYIPQSQYEPEPHNDGGCLGIVLYIIVLLMTLAAILSSPYRSTFIRDYSQFFHDVMI